MKIEYLHMELIQVLFTYKSPKNLLEGIAIAIDEVRKKQPSFFDCRLL